MTEPEKLSDEARAEPGSDRVAPPGLELVWLACSVFMLPLLDWQRAVLKAYRSIPEEEIQKARGVLGRVLMMAGLEYYTQREERLRQRVATESALIDDYLKILESLLEPFDKKRKA